MTDLELGPKRINLTQKPMPVLWRSISGHASETHFHSLGQRERHWMAPRDNRLFPCLLEVGMVGLVTTGFAEE